jgi:hypothetical protein
MQENPAVTFPAHRDWVTKAAYVEKINSIVSSSVDNVLSLYDLEAHKVTVDTHTHTDMHILCYVLNKSTK